MRGLSIRSAAHPVQYVYFTQNSLDYFYDKSKEAEQIRLFFTK